MKKVQFSQNTGIWYLLAISLLHRRHTDTHTLRPQLCAVKPFLPPGLTFNLTLVAITYVHS